MEKMENYSRVFSIFSIEKVSILSHFMPLPCIDTRQGRECAGTDRAGSVHQVFIVQGPCMECSFVVAWTVQGPCIDCPELNDQLACSSTDPVKNRERPIRSRPRPDVARF